MLAGNAHRTKDSRSQPIVNSQMGKQTLATPDISPHVPQTHKFTLQSFGDSSERCQGFFLHALGASPVPVRMPVPMPVPPMLVLVDGIVLRLRRSRGASVVCGRRWSWSGQRCGWSCTYFLDAHPTSIFVPLFGQAHATLPRGILAKNMGIMCQPIATICSQLLRNEHVVPCRRHVPSSLRANGCPNQKVDERLTKIHRLPPFRDGQRWIILVA